MAKKHKHEEHLNAEAWAIPYGDLITLLLAFFVVMYAVSSVNEGKYRVAAASMAEAFNGPPKSLQPIQIGDNNAMAPLNSMEASMNKPQLMGPGGAPIDGSPTAGNGQNDRTLEKLADSVKAAMADLIADKLVIVRETPQGIEVEIQADILFPSGESKLSPKAEEVILRLSSVLQKFNNPVRVEGHTDNVPINSAMFPSNWELSSARAASVVHLLMTQGVPPQRLAVVGMGEYHPVESNDTQEGRNRNRRVLLLIYTVKDQ